MLSAAEIRNVKFSKALSGYKQEEVDILLDKVEADYLSNERLIKEFQLKIETLNKEIEDLKNAQESIQTVLINAQNLADKMVNDAKEKSDEIIKNAEANIELISAQEKELVAAFEIKAKERKANLEAELEAMIKAAKLKADSITAAANDSVSRQQMLFDKLKTEIAAFKAGITAKYKEHLELLSVIPDTVSSDPKYLAELVLAEIDKQPDTLKFIAEAVAKNSAEQKNGNSEIISKSNGFSVEQELNEEEKIEE